MTFGDKANLSTLDYLFWTKKGLMFYELYFWFKYNAYHSETLSEINTCWVLLNFFNEYILTILQQLTK